MSDPLPPVVLLQAGGVYCETDLCRPAASDGKHAAIPFDIQCLKPSVYGCVAGRILVTECLNQHSLQVPVRQSRHRFYHRQSVNYPDDHGFSVHILHVCDHISRYCGKISPKQKWELPRENMHLACRDEYSKRKCDRRCVVCNEKSIRGHSCDGDDGLPGTGYPGRD